MVGQRVVCRLGWCVGLGYCQVTQDSEIMVSAGDHGALQKSWVIPVCSPVLLWVGFLGGSGKSKFAFQEDGKESQ